MKIQCGFQDSGNSGHLTTEHPSSSYGMPVFVPGFALGHYMQEDAYGPGDLLNEPPLVLWESATAEDVAAIKAAGFNLRDL